MKQKKCKVVGCNNKCDYNDKKYFTYYGYCDKCKEKACKPILIYDEGVSYGINTN